MTESEQTIQPGAKKGASPARFRNIREVAEHLAASGWKIRKSAVYAHAKQGKIRPDLDGGFSQKSVEKYAAAHLQRQDTLVKTADEELQRKKVRAELERIEAQTRTERMKLAKEEGRYVLREQVDLELAARAAVIEAGLRQMVMERVPEWIELVGGNQNQVGELIRQAGEDVDRLLHEFASVKEWQVLFEMNAELGTREEETEP